MAQNELPRPVQSLIEDHLHNAADVDTLLLLFRDDRGWTADAVARELRIHLDQATGTLAHLRRRGLLRIQEKSYRFAPRDPAMGEAVAMLAGLYPAYRVRVVSLIYAHPARPVRGFSDAFRLRKRD